MGNYFGPIIGVFILISIVPSIILEWQGFMRHRTLRKNVFGIPLHKDFTLDELLRKLTSELDYPDLISLTLDNNSNIVAECKHTKNLIYIKDKFLFVVPYGYISENKMLISRENGDCLKEYIYKILDPTVELNPQDTLFKTNTKRNRRFITKCICIAIIAFCVIGVLICIGCMAILTSLGA